MACVKWLKTRYRFLKILLQCKERLEREILPCFSTRRQKNAQLLIRHLYQSPLVNVKLVGQLLDVKTNTAAALVDDFVKYGILKGLTGKRRNRTFGFAEYILIFNRQNEQP